MDHYVSTLTIYPTSLALRRQQAHMLEEQPVVDGRRHLSLRMFMDACAGAAQRDGLLEEEGLRLEPATDLQRDLANVITASRFLDQVHGQGVLCRLAGTAVEEVLAELVAYVNPLADRGDDFLRALDHGGTDSASEARSPLTSPLSSAARFRRLRWN